MEVVSISVTFDVAVPSERKLVTNVARAAITEALIGIVNTERQGVAITGASVDRVVRK